MPKRRGQFRGEKRRKELNRLQKQQEKRQRRFGTQPEKEPDALATDALATDTEKKEEGESPTPDTTIQT